MTPRIIDTRSRHSATPAKLRAGSRFSMWNLHEFKAKIEKAFSICARDLCQTDVYKNFKIDLVAISLPS